MNFLINLAFSCRCEANTSCR